MREILGTSNSAGPPPVGRSQSDASFLHEAYARVEGMIESSEAGVSVLPDQGSFRGGFTTGAMTLRYCSMFLPAGFKEISRAKLIDPTLEQLRRRGGVTWSHPAFAYRHVFARNDKELVCADLSARPKRRAVVAKPE